MNIIQAITKAKYNLAFGKIAPAKIPIAPQVQGLSAYSVNFERADGEIRKPVALSKAAYILDQMRSACAVFRSLSINRW
jgi:hypothetical protein